MKAFLVSGDVEFLNRAKDFLEDRMEGLTVDTAEKPKEALDTLKSKKYDAVVSTCLMDKEMDCIDFLMELKRTKEDISFIMVTNEDEEKIAIESLELGADSNVMCRGSPKMHMLELLKTLEHEFELKKIKKELKESERLYKGMYDTMLVLSKHDDLDYLLATIAHEAKSLLNTTDCNIYFYNEDKDVLIPIYSNHPDYSKEIMDHPIPVGEGFTGMVAEAKESKYLNYDDPDYVSLHIPETDKEEDEIESIMGVPLLDNLDLLGVMSVGKLNDKFYDQDMRKLNLFARQVEIALKKVKYINDVERTHKKLYKERDRIRKIHDVAVKMKSIRTEEELYSLVTDAVEDILDFYVCSIDILKNGEFEVKATIGGVNKEGDKYPVEGVAGETLKSNHSFIIDDVQGSKLTKPKRKIYRSAISVPIGDFGVFQALSEFEDDFNQEDLSMTELLMAHVTETIERLRNYRKVKESEEKFKALSESSPFPIFVYRDNFLYVNDASEELTGYSKEELLDMPFWELVHPDHREMVKQRGFSRLKGEDIIPRYEFKIIKKDGTPVWVYFTGRRINYEGESAGFGTAIDITDRKEAIKALKETNRKCNTLMKNLPGMAYRCKNVKNYTMEFLSEACMELTGYQPEDLLFNKKISYRDIIHPDDREYVWESIQKAVKNKEPFEMEYRIITSQNEERWVWEQGRMVEYSDDKTDILEGIITDITKRKKVEDELRKYKDKLEYMVEERTAALNEANKELKALTYSMSHDLKAPLRAIHGFTEELMKEHVQCSNKEAVDCLKRILNASERMDDLIEDLLRYSRVSKADDELTQISLNEVLNEAVGDFEDIIENKNAVVELDDKMPMVMGRYSTMVQIFSNLISNALKFVDDESPSIKIRAERSGDLARIWVEDNGIGIPEEQQNQVFHLFERLHGRDIYPGTGIGLAIVRKAVEKMGGKVGVESELGKGSKFWVELIPSR